jgi:hypothetical protein
MMSNAARKQRKKNGEKFVRVPKVGTPLELRRIREVIRPTKLGLREMKSNRHTRKIQEAIRIRDLDLVKEQ